MAGHAFETEDQFGDALPQDKSGAAFNEKPITSESEAPRIAEEDQKKAFNRVKMGGFLMEFGLNILASNRDDAGGAIGEAGNRTMAARDARRKTRAAEELAKQERERSTRREDESDLLKREKADREVAKEERAISKSELDKLQKHTMADGTVGYYEKAEGPVYNKKGEKIVVDTADRKSILGAAGEATNTRQAKGRFDDLIDKTWIGIKDDFDERLIAILGEDPSSQEVYDYAFEELSKKDKTLLGGKPDVVDYKDWN